MPRLSQRRKHCKASCTCPARVCKCQRPYKPHIYQTQNESASFISGFTLQNRPGGNRTPNLRFWRPTLCQIELLAYSTACLLDYLRLSGTPIFALLHNRLLASYLVSSMFALILAELLEFQFRRTLCHTDIRAIISAATLPTLKPDIFPFAFLFSHKTRLH